MSHTQLSLQILNRSWELKEFNLQFILSLLLIIVFGVTECLLCICTVYSHIYSVTRQQLHKLIIMS